MKDLRAPMTGAGCRAEPYSEAHRELLRSACAEDADIWPIYAWSFDRAKDMMLRRAFASGIRRVEFRVDARNARSQAAMAKLGAVREGVIRADRITWTGHVRDTVLFSILAEEWGAAGGA
jgi:hypothetical protein